MLFHLLYPLHQAWPFFNVFKYITFRTIYATVTALAIMLVLTPWFIRKMQVMQMGQVVRDDGPERHLSKAGTPSMGGVLIISSILFSTLMWADLGNIYIWVSMLIVAGYCCIGITDDLMKITKRDSKGLSGRKKLFFQTLLVAMAALIIYEFASWDTHLSFPFFKNLRPDLGFFYLVFAAFVVVGSSNAVNLTDGLDGLATGPFVITAAVYALFCYLAGHAGLAHYLQIPSVPGAGELAIFCGSMAGAGLGFLWFNTYPAEIFMGDSGSLAMGGALGCVAVLSKQEIILAIAGGVFVMEAVSVMIQVGYFKLSGGRRIFRMAPIHHHFELKGWQEPKVIVRFWIISILLGLLAVSTLKLR